MIARISLLVLFVSGMQAGFAEDSSMRKVSFQPQWAPQAQFAGFYAAIDKGFYQNHNIDLNMIKGGPDVPSLTTLKSGKADLVSMILATAIEQRAQGVKLVNIGQIVQKSSLILVAKKKSGIQKIEDFNGKKMSIWSDFAVQPKALIRKYNLQVTLIPQSLTMTLFLRDAVDISSAMWYNELHALQDAGYEEDELIPFFFSDYGLNFPEDGIYCMEEFLKNQGDLCGDFVKATCEGWQYVFEHPDEALDIVMKYVEQAQMPTNRAHQKWMLSRMKDIIFPEGKTIPLGELTEDDYNTVTKELLQCGVIQTIPEYSEFYENCAKTH